MKKLLFCLFFASIGSLFADPIGYITNVMGDTISIVDLATDTVTGYVDNGSFNIEHPIDVVVTPDGTKAYVVCDSQNEVVVIDVATNTIIRKVDDTSFPFSAPVIAHIALPGNLIAYVTNEGGNNVSVIDIPSDTVIQYLDDTGLPFALPIGLEVSLDGTIGLVVNFSALLGQEVSVFSPAVQAVIGYVDPNGFPFGNPLIIQVVNDAKAYVGNTGTNTVSIIDLTAFPFPKVIGYVDDTFFPFLQPSDLQVSPDQKTVYVVNDLPPYQISVIDVASDTVIAEIEAGFVAPIGFAIKADGQTAYVTSAGDNTVRILDLTTNMQIGFVDASSFPFDVPYQIAFVPTQPPPPPPFLGPLPPIFLQGIKSQIQFLTESDRVNIIKWEAPITTILPVFYKIFRDAGLTDLAGTVFSTECLEFVDHGRKKHSVTHYYVIAVYPDGSISAPAQVTVAQ